MRETLNATMDDQTEKLTKKNDPLEAMVVVLEEETQTTMSKIEEFEGQLIMCGVVVGKGMLASIPKQCKIDYAEEEARSKLRRLTQQGIIWEYVWEFTELLLQILDLRVKELTKSMAKVKSFVELGLRKDKFEFSKPKEMGNGRRDHEKEQDINENSHNCKNGGNGKPPNG
ncbi:hypothetical protein Gogos_021098 [Gossypium gossypioides]|uniref:Retrotransposon gag domain-containing protein n=1 Tax=Gossypium gossypioides TaxID=34282 RepID=A0A7J9D0Z3_GOSGO|nr:hypothetical protein [Gossypium gossypioides]